MTAMNMNPEQNLDGRFERERKINSKKLLEWLKLDFCHVPTKLDPHWDKLMKMAKLNDVEMSMALDDLESFGIIKLDDWQGDTLISLSSRRD